MEARSLGDRLRDYGFLQAAGHCYEAAGEYERANRAFLEAAQPQSEVAARQLREQRNEARTLLRKLQQAFQSGR